MQEPKRHSPAQIQQLKHQNNVWNMFKVKNKDTKRATQYLKSLAQTGLQVSTYHQTPKETQKKVFSSLKNDEKKKKINNSHIFCVYHVCNMLYLCFITTNIILMSIFIFHPH